MTAPRAVDGRVHRRRCGTLVAGALIVLPAIGLPARAQRVEYAGSLQTTAGSYVFDQATYSHSFLSTLTLRGDRWRLGGSIPLIVQNSTVLSYIGGQPLPTGGPNSGVMRDREPGEQVPMRRRGGGGTGGGSLALGTPPAAIDTAAIPPEPGAYAFELGDPIVTAGFELLRSADARTTLGGQVMTKLPVASVGSGVGTGAADYGAALALSLGGARTSFLAEASWWTLGELPDLELRDVFGGTVAVTRMLDAMGRWSVMGSVSASSAILESLEEPLSAGIGFGYLPWPGRAFFGGVSFGFSESSPDWSAYVGWSVR